MADKKISELDLLTPVDNADFIAVVDVSAGTTKKATRADFKGDTGATGAAATLNVGSTTTGAPGSSASVVNSGTTSAAVFDFTIPRGDTGAQGIQGIQGTPGTNGTDGVSFTWLGAYSGVTVYEPNDAVSYNGSSYMCKLQSTGNVPTNTTFWDLMAQKGTDGAGAGDMLASVYDPQNKAQDAFDYSDRQFKDSKRLGFLNQTETTIAFDGINTFTLASVGASWSYYRQGVKRTITGNKTVVLPGSPVTTGKYFISIDANDGTLSQSTTPWTLDDDKVQVATIAFNNSLTPKYQLADERHSVLMDARVHKYHHETEGTKYISGGEPSGYTLNTDTDTAKTFAIAATVIADEDLYQTLPTLSDPDGATNAYVHAYLSGGNWVWEDGIMPFKYTGSGYAEYDNGGTMTAGTNGDFINTYVFYSNIQGAGRYLIFSGKAAFATAALAYAENFGTFSMTGMFTGEGIALYQLTWSLASGNTSKGKCTLNRVQRISSNILTSTSVTSSTHNGLAGLQLAAPGVTYGHIDDQTQTIAGAKTFSTSLTGRFLPRVGTTTSSATPAINTDLYDGYHLTAQAADITSFTTNLSGTPVDEQKIIISITGTGARAITWGASFEDGATTLPTTTVGTTRLDVGFMYSTVTSKWRCMAKTN